MIELGALPAPQVDYSTRWPPLGALSLIDKAKIAESIARAEKAKGGILLTTDEYRDLFYERPPLEDVDPDAAARNEEILEGTNVTGQRALPPAVDGEITDEERRERRAAAQSRMRRVR
jgi:hypothetical protein